MVRHLQSSNLLDMEMPTCGGVDSFGGFEVTWAAGPGDSRTPSRLGSTDAYCTHAALPPNTPTNPLLNCQKHHAICFMLLIPYFMGQMEVLLIQRRANRKVNPRQALSA